MTDTRKAQLEISADASGAERAFDKVKKAGRDMAQAVDQSAQAAGKSVDGIGDGADTSAKKLDKATSSIIASVQRATAAMQAGEKGTAKYFEALASQRGADVGALLPYIEQLKLVEAAQNKTTISTAQMNAALRGVPAQMTDIVTSLQGGQAPMTVLLQQGGQLKDMFGGVGNAAKALGGYVVDMVNPFTLLAAAVGGLGVAWYQGSKEADAYTKALILSGNAVGTTVGQMQVMAQAMASSNLTQGAAAEGLVLFAQNAKVGKTSLAEFTTAALQFSRATGQSVDEVAKQFAELAKDPLAATLKLNDGMNYLTLSAYKTIKALEDQGKTVEAANAAQKAYADTLTDRAKEMDANLGTLERSWNAVTNAIKGAWDAMKNIGRHSLDLDLANLQSQIKAAEFMTGKSWGKDKDFWETQVKSMREQESILQSQVRELRKGADLRAEQAAQVDARAQADKDGLKYLIEQQKMEREIAQQRATLVRAGASQAEIEQRIAQIKSSYAQKHLGGENEIAGIRAKIDATKEYIDRLSDLSIAQPKLTDAEQKMLTLQKELAGSITGVARAQKEKTLSEAKSLVNYETTARGLERWRTEYDQLLKTLDQSAVHIDQQAQAQEAANAVFGKGTVAVQAYALSVLKAQMAEAQGSDRFSEQYINALEKKIKAQERFVESLKAADFKTLNAGLDEWLRSSQEAGKLYADEARLAGLTSLERAKVLAQRQVELQLATRLKEIDQSSLTDDQKEVLRQRARDTAAVASATATAKAVQDEWTKVADQINQSLTDALMRGFESGKGFLQNFADTIKNLFKTMVLRPVIQAIVSPVSGAIALGLGVGGTAAASTSATAGSTSLSALSSVSAVASLAKSVGLLGAGFKAGLSALTGEAGFAGAWSAGTTAIGAGNIAGGVGTLAGALAPAAAGLIAGKLISGGYSVIGSSGNVAVGSGAAIGALLGGPIGAGIGAALGGVVNRLFGRKLADTGLQGTFGGAAGFAGENYQFYKGGWFRSDKTTTSAVDAQLQSGLSKQFLSLQSSTALMAATLGLGTEAIQNFTKDIKLSFQGLNADQINAKLQEQFTQLGEDLASQALGAAGQALAHDGETTAAALSRLSGSLVGVNSVLDVLNKSLLATSLTGADAASQLVDLFGGLQGFQQSTTAYYDAYYSQAEKTAKTTEQVTNGLTALGYAMPTTLAGFRALVDAQDLTTAAGRNTWAALVNLSPAFAQITNAADAAAQALADAAKAVADQRAGLQEKLDQAQGNTAAIRARELAALDPSNRALQQRIYLLEDEKAALAAAKTNTDAALSALQRALDAQKTAASLAKQVATEQVASIKSVLGVIDGGIKDLVGGSAQSTAAAQAYIDQALATARATGYLPDSTGLSDAISTVKADMASRVYTSAAAQQADKLALAARLTDLKILGGEQLGSAEKALRTAQDQLTSLDSIYTQSKAQLDALRGVDSRVKTVAEAVNLLNASMASELRAMAAASAAGAARSTTGGSTNAYQPYSTSDTPAVRQAKVEAQTGVKVSATDSPLVQAAKVLYQSTHGGASSAEYNAAAALVGGDIGKALGWNGSLEDTERLRRVYGFANGGYYPGGLAMVGEQGPELINFDRPGQVYTASQTQNILGGNSRALEALVAEVKRLQAIVTEGNRQARRTADATNGNPEQPMLVETV